MERMTFNAETPRRRTMVVPYEAWLDRMHGRTTDEQMFAQGTEVGEHTRYDATMLYAAPGTALWEWVTGQWVYMGVYYPWMPDVRPGYRRCAERQAQWEQEYRERWGEA